VAAIKTQVVESLVEKLHVSTDGPDIQKELRTRLWTAVMVPTPPHPRDPSVTNLKFSHDDLHPTPPHPWDPSVTNLKFSHDDLHPTPPHPRDPSVTNLKFSHDDLPLQDQHVKGRSNSPSSSLRNGTVSVFIFVPCSGWRRA